MPISKAYDWFACRLDSTFYHRAIYGLIILYTLVLILDASGYFDDFASIFHWTEYGIVVLLCVDIALKAIFMPRHSFRSGWYYFDVVTTLIAFIPGFEPCRAVRLLRLLGKFEFFRDPIEDLFLSLRWIVPLLTILAILSLVLALVGYYAFHSFLPEQFGTLRDALVTSYVMVNSENLDIYYVMFDVAFGPAIVYILIQSGTGLVILSLILAKIIDASHQNDPNSK